MLPVLLPVAALLAALTGCASTSTPHPAALDEITGSWQLETAVPVGARTPTLTIGSDGTLNGNSGVNRFRGLLDTGALTHGHWRCGQLVGSRMAGPPEAMALENQFVHALSTAERALVDGERLRLVRGDATLASLARVRMR